MLEEFEAIMEPIWFTSTPVEEPTEMCKGGTV